MITESEVTLPDALAWLKSLSGDYAAKIIEYFEAQDNKNLNWLRSLDKETLVVMASKQAKHIEKLKNNKIKEGYKLVPLEPTPQMMLHGSNCQHHAWDDKECPMRNSRRSIWKHMCEAVPKLNKAGAQ